MGGTRGASKVAVQSSCQSIGLNIDIAAIEKAIRDYGGNPVHARNREDVVWQALDQYWKANKKSPSIGALVKSTSLSKTIVATTLEKLVQTGRVFPLIKSGLWVPKK